MQQMTPSACSGGNETGKQLIDSRDGKSYWVAKLKDDNCWMTQNLDLDLTNITLSSADSDVQINWTPNLMPEIWSTNSNTDTGILKYYNPGDKYCANNTTNQCSLTASKNNGHDSQGNYYSWNAATAGTGAAIVIPNEDAPSSICPRGWQLPTNNNTSTKSFSGLAKSYNIDDSTAGSTKLQTAPLFFIIGGNVDNSSLGNVGDQGYYWSSTAANASDIYNLLFYSFDVYPSATSRRYFGLSVRCVAR